MRGEIQMKSLKNTDRITKLATALIVIFVAITPQLISYIPVEFSLLSALVIAISEILDQYITEKRVTRAENIKTVEYAEYPEDHLKEEYDKIKPNVESEGYDKET